MNFSDLEFNTLNNDGLILKKNILEENEINKIKKIILDRPVGKGVRDSHFSITISSLLIKLLKLDFKKIKESLYLLNVKNRLKINFISNTFFKIKSNLVMVDGYWNSITEHAILPWHSDQAYSGKKDVQNILSPEIYHLKFFFYLTSVGPNNGCTSYIPCSHKITYAVRSCLFEKKIKYEPFWELKDLVKFINKKENYNHILKKLESKDQLNDFLNKADMILKNPEKNYFDFKASPGDLLIFNDGGVHRGSKPSITERVALRFLYSKKY